MARPLFFYSDAFQRYDMGEQHPLKPRRLRVAYELLKSYGLFESHLEQTEPQPLSREEALQTHEKQFLNVLEMLSSGQHVSGAYRYGFGSGDNPVFPGMYEASLLYSGASADAAQAILDGAGGGQVAFNLSGGLHHAHYDRAAGFCILNDCAIAARRLRRKFARVAYVDIDVHHGDGVQELFYEDPTVLTVSIHQSGRTLFPGTGYTDEIGVGAGAGYSVNIPVAPYTPDEVWIQAWREGGLSRLKAFNPDAIVLQMGTDPHFLDPLANVCLTAQGWLQAVQDVRDLGKPIVAVGGGGYNPTTVPRMWTLAVATLIGAALPDATPDSFSERDRIPTLTDHALPDLSAQQTTYAQQVAAQSIAELQRLLPLAGN